jgi:hypothetical protein
MFDEYEAMCGIVRTPAPVQGSMKPKRRKRSQPSPPLPEAARRAVQTVTIAEGLL